MFGTGYEGKHRMHASQFVAIAVGLAMSATLLLGCGSDSSAPSTDSGSSESVTAETDASTVPAKPVANACGAKQASAIADRLRAAGYHSVGIRQVGAGAGQAVSEVDVLIPGLPKEGQVGISVDCSPTEAGAQASALLKQAGGPAGGEVAAKAIGPVAFQIFALPDVDLQTGENKPIPPLEPILDHLIDDSGVRNPPRSAEADHLPTIEGPVTPEAVKQCLEDARLSGVATASLGYRGYRGVKARTPEGQLMVIAPVQSRSAARFLGNLLPPIVQVSYSSDGESMIGIRGGPPSAQTKAISASCTTGT